MQINMQHQQEDSSSIGFPRKSILLASAEDVFTFINVIRTHDIESKLRLENCFDSTRLTTASGDMISFLNLLTNLDLIVTSDQSSPVIDDSDSSISQKETLPIDAFALHSSNDIGVNVPGNTSIFVDNNVLALSFATMALKSTTQADSYLPPQGNQSTSISTNADEISTEFRSSEHNIEEVKDHTTTCANLNDLQSTVTSDHNHPLADTEVENSAMMPLCRSVLNILSDVEGERFCGAVRQLTSLLRAEMGDRLDQLRTLYELRERQRSLDCVRLVAEVEVDSKRRGDQLEIKYMEELLQQRLLTLAQATTIRTQLKQLIECQTQLAAQQTVLLDHQNSLVLCHARLSHSQAQLMHYQAQLLMHQTQFMLLQTQILQQQQHFHHQQQNAAMDVEVEEELPTSPPQP